MSTYSPAHVGAEAQPPAATLSKACPAVPDVLQRYSILDRMSWRSRRGHEAAATHRYGDPRALRPLHAIEALATTSDPLQVARPRVPYAYGAEADCARRV